MWRFFSDFARRRRTSISKITKQQYTDAFVKSGQLDVPESERLIYFWFNIRKSGGLRLTQKGHDYLVNKLELEHWSIDLRGQSLTQKFLLKLDKFVNCPYTIIKGRWPKIVIFGEQTYFWLALHNKDFEKFLNAYKIWIQLQ